MKKLIAAAVLFALGGCNCDYSDGSRVGIVTKLSRKGMYCKTYEGEMNLGGLRSVSDGNGSSVVANQWAFTVRDNDVASRELLIKAMESEQRVRVTYHEVRAPAPCTSDSGYFVEKVELLER